MHTFIFDELFEDEEQIEIPEKYMPIIKEIAENVDMGMICYLNPETLELVSVPEDMDSGIFYGEDDAFQEELNKIDQEWKQTITCKPPISMQAFGFMEDFVNTQVEDHTLQVQLSNALSRKHPFANFNHIIHNCILKEQWFAYKQKCLEDYVIEELWQLLR